MMSATPSRGLKIAVISMGIALVGGFILLIVLAIGKYSKSAANTSDARVAPAKGCAPASLSLPVMADYSVIGQDKGQVTLLVTREGQDDRVVTVNICDGSIISSLSIIR